MSISCKTNISSVVGSGGPGLECVLDWVFNARVIISRVVAEGWHIRGACLARGLHAKSNGTVVELEFRVRTRNCETFVHVIDLSHESVFATPVDCVENGNVVKGVSSDVVLRYGIWLISVSVGRLHICLRECTVRAKERVDLCMLIELICTVVESASQTQVPFNLEVNLLF